jgi:hypothetical protein
MKVLLPWRNLGCLGFVFKSGLYIDFYRKPHLGMFIKSRNIRIWVSLVTGFIKVQSPYHEFTNREKGGE